MPISRVLCHQPDKVKESEIGKLAQQERQSTSAPPVPQTRKSAEAVSATIPANFAQAAQGSLREPEQEFRPSSDVMENLMGQLDSHVEENPKPSLGTTKKVPQVSSSAKQTTSSNQSPLGAQRMGQSPQDSAKPKLKPKMQPAEKSQSPLAGAPPPHGQAWASSAAGPSSVKAVQSPTPGVLQPPRA